MMKAHYILLALAAFAPLTAAQADGLAIWKKSPATACLMDRSDGNLAKFAAADENCGPVGDPSRASRGYVLSDAVEDSYRAVNSGDAEGAKRIKRVLWDIQNRSPALGSCWQTMLKLCDAASIGESVEAVKPQ